MSNEKLHYTLKHCWLRKKITDSAESYILHSLCSYMLFPPGTYIATQLPTIHSYIKVCNVSSTLTYG